MAVDDGHIPRLQAFNAAGHEMHDALDLGFRQGLTGA